MKKSSPLTVAMVASEAVPYAKSGGLADMVGALASSLARLGHRVYLFVPFYRETRTNFGRLPRAAGPLDLPFLDHDVRVEILRHDSADGVTALLVREDSSFGRSHLYGGPEGDYWDNAGRFAVFCRSVLAGLRALEVQPDIIHAHDWQSALVPLYLRHRPDLAGPLADVPSLFTVHNLAYQGVFSPAALPYAGIPPHLFTMHGVEFHGSLNLLKGGLLYADALTTVSPTYSREILTPDHGRGLDGVLNVRAGALHGILNGVDYEVWNPETDPLLPARYGASNLDGKASCKEALAATFGLRPDPDLPIFGTISRLADQKGFDILAAAVRDLMELPMRYVLLGTGDRLYQDLFSELALRYPDRLAVRIGYDESLAHLIEGGADCYLMPSRFEPCGLNQLYSMRYGTIPVVRAVGGLADTVVPFDAATGKGTGFSFREYSPAALVGAVREALSVRGRPPDWERLRRNAMAADFSWEASTAKYVDLYRALISTRFGPGAA